MSRIELQKKQWELAVNILKENGIKPLDDKMTLSGNGYHIVIYSKDLVNCLQIDPKMSNEEIYNYINKQIEITKQQEFLAFLRNEYVENGYLYSGSVPYNSLIDKGFPRETINKLLDEGLIQKRNCEGLAYELPAEKRKKLIAKHDLCSVWYEKTGACFLEEIKVEARDAAAIPGDKSGITVSTIRHEGDQNKPDKMTVYSPFSVGQVIELEYDLPRNKKWKPVGYADAILRPGGVAVGKFMVTDIFCNLLVSPQINMIELQSLDHAFNQVHPDARTMLIFEDVVLKRLKEPSLDFKIQSAADRLAGKASENGKGFKKEAEIGI